MTNSLSSLKSTSNGNFLQKTISPTIVSNWTTRNAASNQTWSSVCWSPELRLFVAVSRSGNSNPVMTSPDGITWTGRSVPTDGYVWTSVCWAPAITLFVAVAQNDIVITSPDGITWTQRTTPGDGTVWNSVVWSPQLTLFVAVGDPSLSTQAIMTSPDGITWTRRTGAGNGNWSCVTWSPELTLFFAVASNTAQRGMSSPDGITWTQRTIDSATWSSVCWSPELRLFVAVSSTTATSVASSSPDGITWTIRILPSGAVHGFNTVVWSPELGIFVATLNSDITNSSFAYSTNGIYWTYKKWEPGAGMSIVWSPDLGIFCSVGSGGIDTGKVKTTGPSLANSYGGGWATTYTPIKRRSISELGSSYVVLDNDGYECFTFSGGTPTLTLPNSINNIGRIITAKALSVKVTIAPFSGDSLDGSSSSMEIGNSTYSFITFQATSSGNWIVINTGGEQVVSTRTSGSAILLTTNTYADVGSITLQSGVYNITALAMFSGGTVTGTQIAAGIGIASGNDSSGLSLGENFAQSFTTPTATSDVFITLPPYRVRVTSATTFYFKVRGIFSVGTMTTYGKIIADKLI